MSEEDDMDERTNYLIGDNTDPIIHQIIIDEFFCPLIVLPTSP